MLEYESSYPLFSWRGLNERAVPIQLLELSQFAVAVAAAVPSRRDRAMAFGHGEDFVDVGPSSISYRAASMAMIAFKGRARLARTFFP
jgi:hypothetical protein